jgi:hypothetical protein
MAKGYKKQKFVFSGNRNQQHQMFTSTKGKTVKLTGIDPLLLDAIRASVRWPTQPTYEINTALVKDEVHDLTWDIVKDETDVDLAALYTAQMKAFEDATRTANAEFNMRLTKAVIDGGVQVDPDEDTDWIDTKEFLGIGLSKNKKQRKYDYVVSNIIGCDRDLYDILEMVMEMTGVPRSNLVEARGMFRGGVGEEASNGNVASETNTIAKDQG